jgi:nitrile hydratase accessory protein
MQPTMSDRLFADSKAVFDEPWQAHAFALAVRLAETGCFTWTEWTESLSQEIQDAGRRGDSDQANTYYRHWLSALERLCARKGLVAFEAMRSRQAEWRCAYLSTPHGQPVSLSPRP